MTKTKPKKIRRVKTTLQSLS